MSPDAATAFIATCPGGLEGLLGTELEGLGAQEVARQSGGVGFTGPVATAYRVCLWSRLANRVLMPVARFTAGDADALYRGAREVDWNALLVPEGTVAVSFGGARPAIGHSHYASQRIKDALVDRLRAETGRRPDVDPRDADARVHAYQAGEEVTLSLDLAGQSLHRRGYRPAGVTAPLKENLAAAMLIRADWPRIAAQGGPLLDPFCGSGTLPIEAALMAGDVAPGLLRTHWGFQGWRGHDPGAWQALVDEALARRDRGLNALPPLVGYDHDAGAVRRALQAVAAASLTGHVHIERRELDGAWPPPRSPAPGLLASNPPYGERVASDPVIGPLYARFGEILRQRFAGWQAIVLNGAGVELGLRPDRSWTVRNGPIDCRLERFVLAEAAAAEQPEPGRELANRVHKNRRHLRGWLKRTGVTCVRLYDADIPEYALAVDRYDTLEEGPWLHVQEYAPPRTVAPRDAARRLRQALLVLPEATEVAPEQMTLKVRQPQKGREQYQRQGHGGRFHTVVEHGARLRVNFTDYLDTGLFLDHRPVRQWLAEHCDGARFLNLFAYTGAATVHAALGGAAATTSVDLSKTYLDWTRANLEANGFTAGATHALVRADAREWLGRAAEAGDQVFDCILLDPPSFSNSSQMRGTLDIQRDHVDLVQRTLRLLAPGGVLIFSTNRRRFRLDAAALDGCAVTEATDWSLPPDFRRHRGIHQCWFIRHG